MSYLFSLCMFNIIVITRILYLNMHFLLNLEVHVTFRYHIYLSHIFNIMICYFRFDHTINYVILFKSSSTRIY